MNVFNFFFISKFLIYINLHINNINLHFLWPDKILNWETTDAKWPLLMWRIKSLLETHLKDKETV